jgi:hypothetical protein
VANFSSHGNLYKPRRENQMTLKRLLMPMLVMGIVLLMSSMAFAQTAINCGLSVPLGSTPRATATGHTEPIAAGPPVLDVPSGVKVSPPTPGGGALRVTCINNTGAPAGSATDPGVVALTISLGVPITNTTTSHPSATTAVRLGGFIGDFTAANVSINTVSNSGGTIVIGLGTPTGTPTTGITFTAGPFTSSFDILGVLVSTNGKTGAVTASLTSTGGIAVGPATTGAGTASGPASLNVIDSILNGLQDPNVPAALPGLPFFTGVSGGAAVLNSAGLAVKGNFVIRIPENYPDMFRESAQFNGPGTTGDFPQSPSSDTQVQVILNNIPSGLDISGCAATITNAGATAVTGGAPTISFTNITAAAPILTVNFTTGVDLDNLDILWIKCATVGVGTATLPLPSTAVTAQVELAPTGSALSGTGTALTALTTGQVPRYQAALQPATAITVVVFPPSNTTLLLSFGFVGPGYNTGVAVANTTTDPFGVAGGGAAPSEGTVSFLLVKNDGTSKTYTTGTGSPGSGLTGAGVVKSGSTYVVNLSELLSAASFGTTFTGYVFVTANFTNAHGAATIYTTNNGAAALSSPVLVLPAISTAAPRPSPESLGQ